MESFDDEVIEDIFTPIVDWHFSQGFDSWNWRNLLGFETGFSKVAKVWIPDCQYCAAYIFYYNYNWKPYMVIKNVMIVILFLARPTPKTRKKNKTVAFGNNL